MTDLSNLRSNFHEQCLLRSVHTAIRKHVEVLSDDRERLSELDGSCTGPIVQVKCGGILSLHEAEALLFEKLLYTR
jgi:hypothetical protein